MTLTGLTPGTTYGFTCTSTDLDGLSGVSAADDQFFTTAATADTTAPVIVEGPFVVGETDAGFTVMWTTDEPADSLVQYGPAGETLAQFYHDGALTTEHLATIRGLEAESTFEFTISSTDLAGNSTGDGEVLEVATVEDPDEDGPEFVTEPVASEFGENAVLLSWETDELSSGDIAVGFDAGDYELIQATTGLATSHAVLITNLAKGTNYSFVVRAVDQSQNTTLSNDEGEFTTDGVVLTGVPRHIFLPVGQNRAIQVRSVHPGDTSFTFTSDDTSVVTVTSRGVMTGVAEGQARISVTGIASQSTSVILVDVYTLQDPNVDDLSGFFALLSIFLIQDGEGGIGGPCFIATAASGTPLSGAVALLRDFRDEWLLTNSAGTALVDAYYRVSPPVADAVADSPVLALAVRVALLPVLALVALWMKSPLLVAVLGGVVVWRVLRRGRGARAAAR